MGIPLEDNVEDILAKATRGLKLAPSEVAERAGIAPEAMRALLAGTFNEADVRKVAPILGLGPESLVALGSKAWYPEELAPIDGLIGYNTPYGDMFVNAFLVWDPASKAAVAFDTGSDAGPMLADIEARGLKLEAICLTHTHPDHVADLKTLKARSGAPVYVSHLEPVEGAEGIEEGWTKAVGALNIRALATSGHTRGGTTYFVTGLSRPLAAVGDAMFAGSMGGGLVSYADALANNREKILALTPETAILPGHGPIATIGEQKSHNPFFAK